MQNAPVSQKASGDGERGARRRRATGPDLPHTAAALALLVAGTATPALAESPATVEAAATPITGTGEDSAQAGVQAAAMAFGTENFIPAAAQQPAPAPAAPPGVPVGALNSEAPLAPPDSGPDADGAPPSGRVSEEEAVAGRAQLLASLPFPELAFGDPSGGGGPDAADDPSTTPPANIVIGQSGGGVIATLTVTRRVAPEWLVDAVSDDPAQVRLAGPTTAGLPAEGQTRQVSIAWADLDQDGVRDGHLYRIDNANDAAVTVQVRLVNGALLPGSATVDGNTSAFVWVPIATAATVRFLGNDADGAPIAWTRATNTQNTTDMKVTTVSRVAVAGETHTATDGLDVFLFGPGQGVDVVVGYDPTQDSVLLDAASAPRLVDVGGTAAVLVGPTTREGIIFDGIAFTPDMTLSDLNVLFA